MAKTIINYHRLWWVRFSFWLTILFFYAPLITLVIFSFNDSRRNIVWRGFTLKYYEKALTNSSLLEALGNSLIIAFICTLFSLLLGFFAAYSLWRYKFRFKPLYEAALSLPIVIPEIAMGVAMLVFFNKINWPTDWIWPFNLTAIIIAHITFCFPFVAVVLRARLQNFNYEQEEAAMDLNASKLQILWDIVIPFLKPAFLSAFILAFTLSIDDFVITFFTSTPNTVTFPVKIYSMLRFSVTPEVNAISTLLIVVTFLFVSFGLYYQTRIHKAAK